ncbi:hypothetical protein SKAU_G00419580 [Synaphobranchus kaupii]|uniref:ornithine decarboxylase n=1 Tax=Synaphobranchus kaupii TaxID=118154 RepID=A0A9Q1IAZ8_SYNKA|nr:hypothetical protein SKAU_G00419580 [Synaphobranchus kaupii]
MNTFTPADFDFTLLDDGFCIDDIVEQKINELSESAEVGYNMTLLDIGGGFPGSDDSELKFEEFTAVINPALDKYFPADSGVRVIAEPGRYYPTSAYTLAVNIISKKVVLEPVKKLPLGMEHVAFDDITNKRSGSLMYYVNDGIHGSFNQVHFDPHHAMHTLHKKHQQDMLKYPCSIWGPTCDKDDCIAKECIMPDLPTGEWLVFNNMGAYTISMYSNFNGFEDPIIHSVMSRTVWERIQQISAEGLPATVE